ncbi:hypothetical protein C8F04DRAFT_1092928 [Mycena alexandri]|uniref:Uncharacterized protein n=1 Tax=Mycena alexandri TaxID=1745969 RepID=A0AAD6T053_9AGAR|nr:hypothetical protein C8F04DRAFT_1092928 [Mycena alexandri]
MDSKFRPIPMSELKDEADSVENLANEGRPGRQPPRQERKKSLPSSSKALRRLSVILHSTLVVLHLVLIAIWATNLEHRLVFPFDTARNKLISLFITTISTTFGTIYAAVLVFVTQTLSMRRDMQADQTLTATHDHTAAWAGLGAAVSHIWYQKAVPASLVGVLSAFFYLGNILVFHITTPALFSLETFTSTRGVPVQTQSIPALNFSAINPDVLDAHASTDEYTNFVDRYTQGALVFLPSVLGTGTNLGLYGSTLYDVVDVNKGVGNVTVNATGVSTTCGYLPGVEISPTDAWFADYTVNGTNYELDITNTQPGMISAAGTDALLFQYMVFHTTVPVVDSSNNRGPFLESPLQNGTFQFIACMQTPVNQVATVDAESRQFLAVAPDIRKTDSTWGPYTGPNNLLKLENVFDTFPILYTNAPVSDTRLSQNHPPSSVAELYLNQKLNLTSTTPGNLTLHDVENALSDLAASIFWTLSHIPPIRGNVAGCGSSACIDENNDPFTVLRGNATVTNIITQARLDLSIIAVSAGLAASIALMIIAYSTSILTRAGVEETELPIDGLGVLQAIWLYRNHPELETLMDQAEYPSTQNLREAGMVRVRLVDGSISR